MVSYYPLWNTLLKKKMKRSNLYPILSTATVARMGKDEYVSLQAIDKICEFLDCDIADVVMRVPPDKENGPDA